MQFLGGGKNCCQINLIFSGNFYPTQQQDKVEIITEQYFM
jgi:hypothetical protein